MPALIASFAALLLALSPSPSAAAKPAANGYATAVHIAKKFGVRTAGSRD